MIGKTVGHYRIIEKIGEGGMGEVFLAEDAKLDRKVALKFLPPGMASDPSVKARFMQEAKAASALNHPNVCTIHDIQEHDGQMYIVMEYVEGATLAEKKGQLSIKKAVDIVAQVADGLAAAHEKGIVHRDIKAENIMLRSDGIAQIMDFGLAKLRGVSRLTKEGSTVGTTAYMSPEAIQGHDLDYRTDLYSLGVVLFELLTGRLPFDAVHETAVMYEIVNVDAPPPSALKPELDPELDRIVLECLDKDPEERIQSAKGLARDLRRFNRTSSGRKRTSQVSTIKPVYQQASGISPAAQMSGIRQLPTQESAAPPAVESSKLPWIVATVALLTCAALAWMHFGRPAPARIVSRSIIIAPDSTSFASWGGGHLALSPDGARLAFVAADSTVKDIRLWVRPINSLSAMPLPGTEGAYYPFWSADSRYIAFFAKGKLKKIDASGGPPLTLCDAATGRSGSWNSDGVIIFSPTADGILYRVSAAGGAPESLTVKDTVLNDYTHRWPWFLPDGNHFLYFGRTVSDAGGEEDAIRLGSLDGHTSRQLMRTRSNVAYAAGHILFMREGTLMAQPFDAAALKFTGDAFPLAEDVSFNASFSHGSFAVSQNGVLVYQTGRSAEGSQLRLLDRSGKIKDTIGEQEVFYNPALSPDGKRVAVDIEDPSTNRQDIWIYDLERGLRTRFTFDSTNEQNPKWSPDGQWIAYRCQDIGSHFGGIFMKTSDGAGTDSLIYATDTLVRPWSWSPDGRNMFVMRMGVNGQSDIYSFPVASGGPAIPVVASSFAEWDAAPSPDGRWLAYNSDESGQDEVYVMPLGRPGGKFQVSLDDGDRPHWRSDGKEIYYLDADDNIVAVEVDGTGNTFVIGKATHLFQVRGQRPGSVYDVSGDGQTFLVNWNVSQVRASTATLVVNWDQELKQK